MCPHPAARGLSILCFTLVLAGCDDDDTINSPEAESYLCAPEVLGDREPGPFEEPDLHAVHAGPVWKISSSVAHYGEVQGFTVVGSWGLNASSSRGELWDYGQFGFDDELGPEPFFDFTSQRYLDVAVGETGITYWVSTEHSRGMRRYPCSRPVRAVASTADHVVAVGDAGLDGR